MDALIREINYLAKKKKEVGLSPEELELQKELRERYLAAFRSQVRGHIEGLKVVDQEGIDVTPDKLKEIQKAKGLHGRKKED